MKNTDTWQFAHTYIGKLWCIIGCIALLISVVAMLLTYGTEKTPIAVVMLACMVLQLGLLIYSIFMTERELEARFDDEGKLK